MSSLRLLQSGSQRWRSLGKELSAPYKTPLLKCHKNFTSTGTLLQGTPRATALSPIQENEASPHSCTDSTGLGTPYTSGYLYFLTHLLILLSLTTTPCFIYFFSIYLQGYIQKSPIKQLISYCYRTSNHLVTELEAEDYFLVVKTNSTLEVSMYPQTQKRDSQEIDVTINVTLYYSFI